MVEGTGKIGFLNGGGQFRLEEVGADETLVHYEGDVRVGGMIASVGQRLMDMTSKMMIRKFLPPCRRSLLKKAGERHRGESLAGASRTTPTAAR